MGGILLLTGFLACGVLTADALLRRHSGLIRLWIGLCCGLLMMMWLPALYAFFIDFTLFAQLLGFASAAALAIGCQWRMHRVKRPSGPFCGTLPPWLILTLVLPFALLSGWLQYTHILRDVNGALHVGQSTYGDLCLHLGIATSLQNAAFPPDYSILKGTLLGYPFLADSMVIAMLLAGGDLSLSFVLTGTLMMTLVYTGFVIFAWELTKRPSAVVLAFMLMFLNGGLGFIYVRDAQTFRAIFTGFYKTPTNQPDLNLRWVNVICDMMVPQRTLLCGWTILLPALYLLISAVRKKQRSLFVLLGVWAGAMPMIHTHSFLALGMLSAGAMLWCVLHAAPTKRAVRMLDFLCYGIIAVALALPQLLTWTFPQTVGGGSLALRFNWVNNDGAGRLIENYFWFWIKNVGPAYLLIIPAVFLSRKGSLCRMLAAGALIIYTVAELIQFQPNEYDNNKLFYVAYMVMTPCVGLLLARIGDRIRLRPVRALLTALFVLVCTLSSSLTIGREIVSDYQLLSAAEVEAANFINDNTPEKSMILTGDQHNNAVAALTGRYILCGTGSYLYFHGVDYSAQYTAMRLLYENPAANALLFDQYGIDFVYISSQERSKFTVDQNWYAENCEMIFDNHYVQIYAVPETILAQSFTN